MLARLREGVPVTGRGLLLLALAGAAFWFLGVKRLDLVLLSASALLAVLLLALLSATVLAALALRHRLRRSGQAPEIPPPAVECGTWSPTGFRAALSWWLPFLTVRVAWLAPPEVETVLPGGVELACARRRALGPGPVRRIRVGDILGLTEVGWTLGDPGPVRILPRRAALDPAASLTGVVRGEDLSDPRGEPSGDRVDIRRYGHGDPMRMILWKVYARTRKAFVRIPERAVEPAPRMCAYLPAGPGDEPPAQLARTLLERGLLGPGWRFGADGAEDAQTLDEALTALARSGSAAGPTGFRSFLERAGRDGFGACLLLLPGRAGPWTEAVRAALPGAPLNVHAVYAVEGWRVAPRPRWQRAFLRPPAPGGAEPGEVLDLLGRIGLEATLVDTVSGDVLARPESFLAREGGMSRVWAVLQGLLWMAAMALAAGRFTLATGAAGAALGALLGFRAGARLARSPLRAWAIAVAALAAPAAALLLGAALTRWPGPARLLGPRLVYALAELLPATLAPLGLVAALEALGRRRPVWRLAGLAVLAVLFAALFAAHRQGFFNRPYFLVDPLWGHGLDPLPWFLFLGLSLAVLLAAVLVGESPGRRTLAGLAVLAAALVAAFLALPQRHLKQVAELHRVLGEGGKDGGGGGGSSKQDGQDGGGQPQDGHSRNSTESFEDQSPSNSDAPLAVVVFHNDYKPPMGLCYFRESAFSAWNGARVVQDAGGRFDRDLPGIGAPALPGPRGAEVRTTVAVTALHAKPFGLVSPVELKPAGNPDPKRFFQAYEVRSRVCLTHPRELLEAPLGAEGWDAADWAHYTEGPKDPRYRDLVAAILAPLPEKLRDQPFARAVAIKLWMDHNCIYSLDTRHGESADPVGDFLFGDRRGHCVYLAHAACLLYRAAGLPARVAGGYAADADFRFGGASLLLRASNAHAWPELRLREQGWLPLDITPVQSEAPPQQAPDKDLQQMLGEMAMSEKPPPPPPPEQGQVDLRERLLDLARLLGLILLALLLLALPAALAVRLWRRWAPWFCRPEQAPRLAYRAALDLAAGHGLVRRRGETREAFAARAAPGPAFAELTALHLRWALGRRRGPDPRCLPLLKAARAEFRNASGPARRWLSFLNLLAWARVH